jgi:glycosyltransferase involved in cell wall biosynthesis
MSKYPGVLFFRYDKYNDADNLVKNLDCDVHISNNLKDIEKLYSTDIHVLVTYGPNESEYIPDVNIYICNRLLKRWIHYKEIIPEKFQFSVNYCYIDNVINDRIKTRPTFSIFTTSFNSFDKIMRPYYSLKSQTEKDWEWVIVDDSTDETNWTFLKEKFINEPKIRLYKKSSNSGNIGNVKNEAIGLCRGNYILELDHDDEILPNLLKDAIDGFTKYPDVGFIYMDFINIYENGNNFSYGDFVCKGFGGYYYEYYRPRNQWVKVYVTPQINNITTSYLFCMPNHPRIWRREKLLEIGSFSELLPICDDQEIILRTIYNLKILKIPKFSYIQYFNNGGSNFSLIRNHEINRLGPNFITPQFKAKYPILDKIKNENGWHDPKYDRHMTKQIWLRDDDFESNYINQIYNPDYDMQFGIIGIDAFNKNLSEIKELYKNLRNDFILLDNKGEDKDIMNILIENNLSRFKFYILKDITNQQLLNYFDRIYKSVKEHVIFQ